MANIQERLPWPWPWCTFHQLKCTGIHNIHVWLGAYAGVPKAYKILQPFPKGTIDQCWSQKQLGCNGTMAKIGYSHQIGTSSQSEGYSSKWLIWLVRREPLLKVYKIQVCYVIRVNLSITTRHGQRLPLITQKLTCIIYYVCMGTQSVCHSYYRNKYYHMY